MKDMSKVEKVETPVKKSKPLRQLPLPRRTMGGKYRTIKARGFGAATRGYDFHERD